MANEAEVPLVQDPARDPQGLGLAIRKLAMIINSLIRKGQLSRTRDPLIKGDVWEISGAGGDLTDGVYTNATVTVVDGAITNVANGSSGNSGWEATFTKPVLADFTPVNDTNYTASDETNGVFLWKPTPSGSDDNCLMVQTPPAGDWDLVARMQLIFLDDGNQYGGICLYESATGKLYTFGVIAGNEGRMLSIRWNSVTSYNSDSKGVLFTHRNLWFKIHYDNTGGTYQPWWSWDGFTWMKFGAAINKTPIFTTAPDRVGFFSNAAGGNANGGVLCMSFDCS